MELSKETEKRVNAEIEAEIIFEKAALKKFGKFDFNKFKEDCPIHLKIIVEAIQVAKNQPNK